MPLAQVEAAARKVRASSRQPRRGLPLSLLARCPGVRAARCLVIRVTHPAIASLSRIALGMAALALPAGLAAGCAGYAQVDGYDADYVDAPPPEVVAAPTYRVNDGYIYVAN